ncbi:MAG TPA: hypothetical protein DEP47_06935 [Chloroflexi bacterium]|jgi:hypothetical protein|nr:hypothetical protein [Chloroflexota bacterium]
MSGITIPVILTVVAVIVALAAYRGIRRGGARFYTLERETMLRRASFTLIGSVVLFLAAIGLLVYNYQQTIDPNVVIIDESGSVEATVTAEPELQIQPPTPSPTATADPNIPTATPTPVICRAIVDGTSGSGLTLREAPSGPEMSILPDGTILTLLEDEPDEVNDFTWRKVRTVSQEEGWVVEDFLKIGDCN